MERVTRIELVSLPWQGNVIAIIRYPREVVWPFMQKGRDNIIVPAPVVNSFKWYYTLRTASKPSLGSAGPCGPSAGFGAWPSA